MHPRIDLGAVTIHTYGLMLAVGLAVGIGLAFCELRRKGRDPAVAIWVGVIAIPTGVVGSRLLFVIAEGGRLFDTAGGAAVGGLHFYGGLALVLLVIYPFLRWNGVTLRMFGDAAAPGAVLGRGIGRIGCHLAGDGDYGLPTRLPWGTDYSHGVYPPSHAVARLPELARQFPGGIAPDDLPMHPTGIYEFLLSALVFAVLWRYRARIHPDGALFMLYFVATGAVRFVLEFVALEPSVAIGLTEAQLISLALIASGAAGLWHLRRARRRSASADPSAASR